jgi:hypothetical protein
MFRRGNVAPHFDESRIEDFGEIGYGLEVRTFVFVLFGGFWLGFGPSSLDGRVDERNADAMPRCRSNPFALVVQRIQTRETCYIGVKPELGWFGPSDQSP